MKAPDVQIEASPGHFYIFTCRTARARRWAERHVAEPLWMDGGCAFPCDDRRYAMDIAAGMQRAGLVVA